MSSITGKRGSTESPVGGGGGSGLSEKKRARIEFDHDRLVATSEEELNIGVRLFFLFLKQLILMYFCNATNSYFESKTVNW